MDGTGLSRRDTLRALAWRITWEREDRGPCVALPFRGPAEHEPMGAAGRWLLRALARRAPAVRVALADLVATQPGVAAGTLDGLLAGDVPGALPLVVRWHGALYINDGHHRATAAWCAGQDWLWVRLLDLDAWEGDDGNQLGE